MARLVGTTSGLAGNELSAMLSGPIRMTAEYKPFAARSMVKPDPEKELNGATSPEPVTQTTSKLAGSHT